MNDMHPIKGQDALLAKLKAVSDENRFSLLTALREPKSVNEIELKAEADTEVYRGDRPLTRQGIQYHLDILREVGLVAATHQKRDGHMMNVHQLDPCGMYTFLDDLERHLGDLASTAPAVERPTVKLENARQVRWPEEPRLVVVRGLTAGNGFSLAGPPPRSDRGWIVGRSPTAEIPLPYDPYIDPEHSEILPDGNQFHLLDLRSSENRIFLNDTPVGRGEGVDLDRGDVIRVGRSELLYQGP